MSNVYAVARGSWLEINWPPPAPINKNIIFTTSDNHFSLEAKSVERCCWDKTSVKDKPKALLKYRIRAIQGDKSTARYT